MNFTAKSRYALKIMMDLADSKPVGKQQRSKIANRQGISVDFMDHIMAKLRSSQLIESTRGRFGGFELKQAPEEISLWDIFIAVEDNIYPVQCIEDHDACKFEASCISYDAWSDVFYSIKKELTSKSLAHMVEKWQKKKVHLKITPEATSQECKAPSKGNSEKN